eukprot:gnl/TRDRNA2_/TRDRNA2_133232_c0_seq1.p1 gnl/TRDRNA2_/TRDRNA2_133232_c0~~gnl/TRDRNA2_/TRDRNA2_133232_c0_seq1.p1  ORF type:complete len:313 (-),score=72.66 gnl/TRDRNA2_/TRDRNA2_133232_c0_seq1:254-1192(-)
MCFTSFAQWLTERENHRTYSEYAYHFLAKTVVFKFINCYVSLYYIAFLKQHGELFGMAMKCVDNDCLKDLGSQLAIFMLMRLTLQNFIELGVPYLYMWYRNFTERRQFHSSIFSNPLTVMPDMSSAEKQSKREEYDLFDDFDEILILYGYTTLFISACPWVPFVALICCVLECFLDHWKLVFLHKRPMPLQAKDNEPWDTAFDVVGFIAMMTNAALVVFSSHDFKGWRHHTKIIFFLGIEHAIIIGRILVAVIAPAVPRPVKLLDLRQKVIVRRHLDLGGEEDDHETRSSALATTVMPPTPVYDRDEDEDLA